MTIITEPSPISNSNGPSNGDGFEVGAVDVEVEGKVMVDVVVVVLVIVAVVVLGSSTRVIVTESEALIPSISHTLTVITCSPKLRRDGLKEITSFD